MENNPKYFSEIVFLRAFAILAVVSVHVTFSFIDMSEINFSEFLYWSINTFSQFAVPLFVCISGFVLFNRYQGSYSIKKFYKKRFLSVVPQYTFFTIFAILYFYIGNIHDGKNWSFYARDIIYEYLTGTAYYHLWFFILIIELYILYPILEKVFTKSMENHKIGVLLIFLLIVQILFQIFSIEKMDLIGNLTIFLGYMFYFVLGMFVRSNYLDYKKRVIILNHPYIIFFVLLIATILGIGINYIDYFRNYLIPQLIQIYYWIYAIETPFYYILIFTLCLFIALKISEIPKIITKCLEIIGNYSFGIFLIEPFILGVVITIILPRVEFNANNWLFYPIVYLFVLSLSVLFVHLMNKIPYHEYIIGSSR